MQQAFNTPRVRFERDPVRQPRQGARLSIPQGYDSNHLQLLQRSRLGHLSIPQGYDSNLPSQHAACEPVAAFNTPRVRFERAAQLPRAGNRHPFNTPRVRFEHVVPNRRRVVFNDFQYPKGTIRTWQPRRWSAPPDHLSIPQGYDSNPVRRLQSANLSRILDVSGRYPMPYPS